MKRGEHNKTGRRRGTRCLAAAACLAVGMPAWGDPNQVEWSDPAGDADVRRTDPGADGTIMVGCNLPDVIGVKLSGWEAQDATTDPYMGWVVDPDDAHLFRLDIEFVGLVGPPGTLGLNGEDYDPHRYSSSPLYGFLELDIDDQKNTGGVLGAAARQRYLANVARFGQVPEGSLGERAARSADDYDDDFYFGRQYERLGSDWDLAFCGCVSVSIVSEGGDGNQVFDPGETWVIRGRFFERSPGYVDASDAFGGSDFGHYDPKVNVRFRHSIETDTTTVTLVYALDMAGAAALTGQPEQPIDLFVGNHTSIVEGMTDIIENAGSLFGPVKELAEGWEGRDPYDSLDPTRWEVLALFGTAYIFPEGALYAWTDTGFGERPGDVNGDGVAGQKDKDLVIDRVYALDGTAGDADGVKDGRVRVPAFGLNFSLFDIDGDGWIDAEDLWAYGHRADLNLDGSRDLFDFLAFTNLFNLQDDGADFDLNGVFDLFDFLGFVNAFNQ